MGSTAATRLIEQALASDAEIYLIVEEDDGRFVVTGMVSTQSEHDVALDIVGSYAGGQPIDDNIEVQGYMPEHVGGGHTAAGEYTGLDERGSLEPGDFSSEELVTDPVGGSGAGPSSVEPDASAEGDVAYAPPVDPVAREGRPIGGFEMTSLDDDPAVSRSTIDGRYSDDAIADAVRRELREDASTSDLEVHTTVRNGMVHLRGNVLTIDDVENAEAVASRVAGVVGVHELLEVAAGRIH